MTDDKPEDGSTEEDEEQGVEREVQNNDNEEGSYDEPQPESGGRFMMPDGKGGYRPGYDWEEERERGIQRQKNGQCNWLCPTHKKFCARSASHAGLGHACEDCLGTP
ncbi:hypothetical protein [Gimesia chilikensis]|uniref:hypothetical protein n=1 Tax=Gimesia chilikensis TaxID=2605989 RepID=UPI003A929FAD